MGCRKIVRVLEVFSKNVDLSVPHHTTVRQWIMRYGCYSLQKPLDNAEDWICIGDLTISVGKLKCLATLGVRMCSLEQRKNLTLSHADVEVIGLYPTEKSTGKFIEDAFEDSAKRIGGNFLATVLDRGSDIKMGAKLFQQNHQRVKIIHDIAHKLSNLVEHELKNDAQWPDYIKQLNHTRLRSFQTELAALMPKKQRAKARFMDISCYIDWPNLIDRSKSSGCLNDISEERYVDYFGWINQFTVPLETWRFIEGTVKMIKETVRIFGLSVGVFEYIKMFLEEASFEGERLQSFIRNALGTIWEEVEKLDEGQTLICSTEVLESVFGKYKAINEGLHGITGNILGICTFVGQESDVATVKNAMESCSVKRAVEFVKEKFGQSLPSFRRKYFPSFKRTKFDRDSVATFTP